MLGTCMYVSTVYKHTCTAEERQFYILLSTFLHLRICPPTSPLLLCLSFYYRRLEGETQKVKTRVLHVENGPVSGLVMAAAGRLSTQMASTSISLAACFFPLAASV